MSAPLGYHEQRTLENQVERLQRDISELRWSLSDRATYDVEISWLAAQKAALEKLVAEEA